jgi:hypothetical protein
LAKGLILLFGRDIILYNFKLIFTGVLSLDLFTPVHSPERAACSLPLWIIFFILLPVSFAGRLQNGNLPPVPDFSNHYPSNFHPTIYLAACLFDLIMTHCGHKKILDN